MDIVVAGLGESVKVLAPCAEEYHTFGLNDIARHFTPDHLVVLDGPERFEGHDREGALEIVKGTRPRAAAWVSRTRHVDDPENRRPKFPRWENWPGCETVLLEMVSCVPNKPIPLYGKQCPSYQTSAFAAACLAFKLNPKRIGLIGIDILDDCAFSRHGFEELDAMFGQLCEAMAAEGVSLVNLSPISALSKLPRVPLSAFHKKGAP